MGVCAGGYAPGPKRPVGTQGRKKAREGMRRVCAEGMRRALFVFWFSGQIEEERVCAGVCAVYIYRFPDTFFFNIHGVCAGVCAVYI